MKYATYNEYKPSNIGWIRDFPAHWELKRLKYVANRAEVKVEADEDNPLPYIGLEHVEPWTGRLIDLDDDLVPTGVSNRFAAGDTLFGKLRPYLAKACNVDFDGLCSSELLVLRGKTYDRKFLLYQLLSHGFINLVDSSTYGSKMPRASWDFIGICELPLPPINEQQTIARFLDAKTAQIDALVAQKRQLIDKLKEKRQALIARTVTRGLPPEAAKAAGLEPNPELTDSGVEWMGGVPAAWKVIPLKWRSRCTSGDGIATEDVEPNESAELGIPVVGGNGLMGYAANSNIDKQVLVIGRVGALCGNVHIVNPPAWITDNALVLRPKTEAFDNRYLAQVLRFRNLNDIAAKTAQPLITGSQVRDQRVPCPPMHEQIGIANFLDSECLVLDGLIGATETAIARLTEYRQALITSAVTGKIDVRELA
jgi:type I restriction enzyme S subunit